MAEITVIVSDDFLNNLKKRIGLDNNAEILSESLSFLNWAVEERMRGRLVLSANKEGKDVERLGGAVSHVQYDEEFAKTYNAYAEGWQEVAIDPPSTPAATDTSSDASAEQPTP